MECGVDYAVGSRRGLPPGRKDRRDDRRAAPWLHALAAVQRLLSICFRRTSEYDPATASLPDLGNRGAESLLKLAPRSFAAPATIRGGERTPAGTCAGETNG